MAKPSKFGGSKVTGKTFDVEPIPVRGFFTVLEHILKLPEEEAAVVEHAVQHDADAPLVGLLHQFHQGTLIPEMRVDTGVIVGVVLMVCGSFKIGVRYRALTPNSER